MYPVCLNALRRVGAADAAPPTITDARLKSPRELCYQHFQPILEEVFHEPRKKKLKGGCEVSHSLLESIRGERRYRITDELIDYFHALYWEFAEAIERLRVMPVEDFIGTNPETYIRNALRAAKSVYLKRDASGSKLAAYPAGNGSNNSKLRRKGKTEYPPLKKREAPEAGDFETFELTSRNSDVEVRDIAEALFKLVTPMGDDVVVDHDNLELLEVALGDNGPLILKALCEGANIGEAAKLLSRRKRKALNQ